MYCLIIEIEISVNGKKKRKGEKVTEVNQIASHLLVT